MSNTTFARLVMAIISLTILRIMYLRHLNGSGSGQNSDFDLERVVEVVRHGHGRLHESYTSGPFFEPDPVQVAIT